MAYIYKITNKKNGKIYIGKTIFNIQKRWNEHCNDYLKDRNEKRPLYSAMRKYGIECFEIDLVEKVSNSKSSKREIFWIELLGTFKNGYNATIGGDGTPYIDYDLVVKLYKKYKVQKQVAEIMGIDVSTVGYILNTKKIKKYSTSELIKKGILNDSCCSEPKAVLQLSRDGKPLKTFVSLAEAGRFLEDVKKRKHIGNVCSGRRKTAYGYRWEFI